MKGILNSSMLIITLIMLQGCTKKPTYRFQFGKYTFEFNDFKFINDNANNLNTDLHYHENFLIDYENNINALIVLDNNNYYTDFNTIESSQHQFCLNSDSSYPKSHYLIYRNKHFYNKQLEIEELQYYKEENKYFPVIIKTIVDQSGSVSVRFSPEMPINTVIEMLNISERIFSALTIEKTSKNAVEQ